MPIPKANQKFAEAIQSIKEKEGEDNFKLRCRLRICLESLEKYPLDLPSANHCRILEGFNKEVVRLVEERLKKVPICNGKVKNLAPPDLMDISISPIKDKRKRVKLKKRERLKDVQNLFIPGQKQPGK